MLLQATMLKPACIVGTVNLVARIRELLLSRVAAQMKNLTGSTTSSSTSTAETDKFFHSVFLVMKLLNQTQVQSAWNACSTWKIKVPLLIVCISFRQLGKCSVYVQFGYTFIGTRGTSFFLCGYGFDKKKRGCMTDDTFEQQLLLKANRHLLRK